MCRTPVARVMTAATAGATYPQGSQASECLILHHIQFHVLQSLHAQIGHVGTSGQDMAYSDACEPWGYVAPVVAAFVTRATGVRHIYLIEKYGIFIFGVKAYS